MKRTEVPAEEPPERTQQIRLRRYRKHGAALPAHPGLGRPTPYRPDLIVPDRLSPEQRLSARKPFKPYVWRDPARTGRTEEAP